MDLEGPKLKKRTKATPNFPEVSWRPADRELWPHWSQFKQIGLDIETADPSLKTKGPGARRGEGYIIGVSIAWWSDERPNSIYLPFAHGKNRASMNNHSPAEVLAYLSRMGRSYDGDIVGANLPYDLDWLDSMGIRFPKATFKDIQIAEPLIDETHTSYSLKSIAERYERQIRAVTGSVANKFTQVMETAAAAHGIYKGQEMGNLWYLDPEHVAEYAMWDAMLPLIIMREQEKIIARDELQAIWDLECAVLPCLLKMRYRGIRVDRSRLGRIKDAITREEKACYTNIHLATGHEINEKVIWNATKLIPILEERNFQFGETPTGRKSIRAAALEASPDKVIQELVKARKKNKLANTFIGGMENHMVGDRVHASYMQIAAENEGVMRGVRYGRLSCRNPNLQQQPKRDPSAAMWRDIFRPETDYAWASCDYSQQEPRWATQWAALEGLSGADEALHEYIINPNVDNHAFMAELTGLGRDEAKAVFLGLCYGEGGGKLSETLGFDPKYTFWEATGKHHPHKYDDVMDANRAADEYAKKHRMSEAPRVYAGAHPAAQKIINRFNEKVPFIKELRDKFGKKQFIRTSGDRRLKVEQGFEYKALNRLIQGSAADQAKAAIVDLEAEGFEPILQVHDEFAFNVQSEAEAEAAAEVMRNAHKRLATGDDVTMKFRVDVDIGPSWGESGKELFTIENSIYRR